MDLQTYSDTLQLYMFFKGYILIVQITHIFLDCLTIIQEKEKKGGKMSIKRGLKNYINIH